MPTFTVSYTTEAEKRAFERAIAFVAEMHALGLSAPDGSVLDACEALTLSKGRDFLRETLAGGRSGQDRRRRKKVKVEAPCGHRTRSKGRRPRSVVTAVGKIALARDYRLCCVCNDAGFPADAALGLDGSVTRRALRMICHVGASNAFDRGERTLRELTGWSIDAETVRRFCHAEAAKCRENEAERREVAEKFAKAAGDREVQIDAGKVNTDTGWRDVKVVSFAVRPPGPPSTSEDYEQRDLPKPLVRRVSAAIETAEDFGRRCRAEAERLELTDAMNLTVLGDGAEWIWNLAAERFPKADQNLDVYHATEYLTDLARAGFGGDGSAVKGWSKSAQKRLVADGWAGVCEFVHASGGTVKDRAAFEAAYPKAANYLAGHRDRMKYAARLRQGKSIGSGMIEGTIKQMLGRRLKQTGARWKTKHVAPFVELVAFDSGPEWESYWTAA